VSLFGNVEMPGHPDLTNCRKLDLLPIPFIRKAHRLGIGIDREYFHALTSRFGAEMRELEKDIANYIPKERLHEFAGAEQDGEDEDPDFYAGSFNAGSWEQVSKLLFDMLGIGEGRKLKRTEKGMVSTGKRQLELVRLDHPIVPVVLRYRELNTLITKYTATLPGLARYHPKGDDCPVCELSHATESWRVHGEMGTTRADTGRINHKKPNLGNIPVRTDDGRAVQAGFVAPQGSRLVTRDLSQIELRDLAHLANVKSMIAIYLAGGDIHDNTARKLFELPDSVKPDKNNHRLPAKRTNFSIQNGVTGKGLYLQIVMDYGINKLPVPKWLTEDWCDRFIIKWLDEYFEVRDYFDLQHYRVRRYGRTWEPLGRCKLIPEIKSVHAWIRESGLRQAQNFPITSFAAGQLKLSMGAVDAMLERVREAGVWAYPLLSIHDAVMSEVEEDAAEDVLEATGECMDHCMDDVVTGERMVRVPIESDGEVMWDESEQVSRWKKAA